MKLLREIIGYVLGGVLFVALMPTVMWLASPQKCGREPRNHPNNLP